MPRRVSHRDMIVGQPGNRSWTVTWGDHLAEATGNLCAGQPRRRSMRSSESAGLRHAWRRRTGDTETFVHIGNNID